MSVREEAKRNLELAGFFKKDGLYNGMIGEAVMKLINCHFDEGHSGMSHEIAVNIFYKVANNQALTAQFWDEMFEKNKEFIAKYKGEWTKEMHENVYGKRPTEEDQ